MTLLPSIRDSWAFSEKPMEIVDIPALYVPFRDISGANPEQLADSLQKSQLFHLVEGTRGDGKSCFLRFLAAGLYTTNVFTIFLNTFGNAEYSNANIMAKWLIGRISNAIGLYSKIDEGTKKHAQELMAAKVTAREVSERSFLTKIGGWFNMFPQILGVNVDAIAINISN